MKAAVFDTNVIVSGFLSSEKAPGKILDLLVAGSIRAVLEDRITTEYRIVLLRPRFHLPPEAVHEVLDAIESHGIWIPRLQASALFQRLPDPDDKLFAESAHAAGVPLVTGNLKHFPRNLCPGIQLLAPTPYLDRLETRDA